jgi:hypothetical protein
MYVILQLMMHVARHEHTDFHIICKRDDGNISRLPLVWHLTDDTDPLLGQCSASWACGTKPNRGRHQFIRALVLQIFNMNSFRLHCKSYKITIKILCSETFYSKCRTDKGLTKKGKYNRSLKVAVQGPDYYGPPLMHSFILYLATTMCVYK